MIKLQRKISTAFIVLASSLSVATLGNAQDIDQINKEHFSKLISEKVIRQIERNPDRYLKLYTQQLYRITNDGNLTVGIFDKYKEATHAVARATKIAALLKADINGDGLVTREELSYGTGNNHNKANMVLQFVEADVDHNNAATFQEISEHADKSIRSQNSRFQRRNNFDLMVFDNNQDGSVNVTEIAESIKIISKQNFCKTVCQ